MRNGDVRWPGSRALLILSLGFALLVCSATRLSGQVDNPANNSIEPGQKLRVDANDLILLGRFAGFAADSLLLQTGRSSSGPIIRRLPMSSVVRLEKGEPCPKGFSRCRKKMSALLGGVGLVVGGLVGWSLGADLFCEGPCGSEFIDEEGLAELQGVLIFGVAGGVLGYVAGMLLPKTDWQELNVDEIGMTLRPRPDSGFTLTFSAQL